MRRRLDTLLEAPGLTPRRFVALAIASLVATTVVIAAGLQRDGTPYGLLAAAYSRPAPRVEVAAAPAATPAPAAAPDASADDSASADDASASDTVDSTPAEDDSGVASTPTDTTPTSTPQPSAPTRTTPAPAKQASKIKHVFVVDISGNDTTWADGSPATYLNGTLKPQGVFLGGYRALQDGDLASLIALTSGQEASDPIKQGCPQYDQCTFPLETLTLPDQVLAKGLTWRAYVEDATGPCDHAATHNPFVYFNSLTGLGECTSNDLPFDGLADDLKAKTPNFTYIAPNPCHGGWQDPCADGTPGGPAAADAFLSGLVPQILASDAYKNDGLLVVLSDTGALFVSPLLPKGAVDQTPVDAFSVLRYLEDLFGLDYLGKAKSATPLTLAVPTQTGSSGT